MGLKKVMAKPRDWEADRLFLAISVAACAALCLVLAIDLTREPGFPVLELLAGVILFGWMLWTFFSTVHQATEGCWKGVMLRLAVTLLAILGMFIIFISFGVIHTMLYGLSPEVFQ